ncbi:MAG: hypothetical protein COY36_03495 [Zetaproteobacteria bacterium CG_4_10_14_0_2_um_filter_55_20]|nr:MAG: hypothetical protein COZ01_02535 [Zetaproteobacteria bacterium CG_4_10_14_0_8_um_filter_55_43]PIZ39263.1 MAG: hypothetical protein COY36_03495 [Zetaproteobacteria bacterium CG_4_10_14_0_2_um_filter_55_20]
MQFTGKAFTCVLKKNDIRISMDGKGGWMNNVFIERLWRSVRYEEIYIREYDSVTELVQALDGKAPAELCSGTAVALKAALDG